MQLLASHATTTVQVKIDKKRVTMFFNQQAKIKKPQTASQPPSGEFAHYSNLEQSEQKIVFKDKWPVPLNSSSFLTGRDSSSRIHFGSTYPSFTLKSDPIDYDIS
jgi:hypothetical protein